MTSARGLHFLENAAGVDADGHPLPSAPDTKDLMERVEARIFDHRASFPRPEPVFSINGIAVCTRGNLTSISAQVKAGKSAQVSAMIAATMADPEARRDCLGVTSSNPNGFAVIHLDTEQSLYDHHELGMRTLGRAGILEAPPWFRSFCLTGFTVAELLLALPRMLEKAKVDLGGIHSVFIDGIGDMVLDVNDSAESNGLVAELHALAILYDCAIVGVIHTNPGTQKTRGHLGSQFERKSETNLSLEKDGDVTVVWSDKNRRAPIPKDKGSRYEWSDEHKMHVSTTAGGRSRADAQRAKLLSEAQSVFLKAGRDSLPWGEFIDRLKDQLRMKSESGSRKRMEKMEAAGVIAKDLSGEWRLAK